ncbi:hypothetical protein BSL78_24563 [Apostichopus japonicus]|uniref:Uncharacterized protein n=1 Tax=Stichopus japonicus TaxID=307972 RepID=A0A2G8JSB2_STIJA|nr:hypothetical protein BSL78_24563 [Apostichopus japonicus]
MEANLQKRAKGKYKSLKNLTSPEKRKWRKAQKQRYEATRIHLGNQVERWTELKEKLGLKNDTEVARYLLDSFSFDYTDVGDYIIPHDTPGSIDRDSDPDWDSGEEDADSSDMSVDLNVSHPEQPADLDLDTILSFAETDQSKDEDVDDGTGSEACAEDTLFITYKESLLQLLKDCRPKSCVRESCQSPPQDVTKFVGTAVGVKWICVHDYVVLLQQVTSKLGGILHHVDGDHEWALGDGVSPACCQHGPLPASQKDLEPDSPAHAALREIVLDMNLIRNIKYYTKFRHTSALENFQSHVLVYAAKRFAYGPPSYKARNLLAGIDYQHHKGRRQAERDGEPV